MARRSTGALYAWALVFFGLWATSATIIGIVAYTKIEDHKNTADKIEAKYEYYLAPADFTNSTVEKFRNDAMADTSGLTSIVTGYEAKLKELENELNQYKESGGVVDKLKGKVNEAEGLIKELQEQLTIQKEANDRAVKSAASYKDTADEDKKNLEGRVAILQSQIESLQNQTQEIVDELKDTQSLKREELEALYVAVVAERDTFKDSSIELAERVEILEKQVVDVHPERFGQVLVDAQVENVVSDQEVFINIGAAQNAHQGLTFEVFEQDELIKADNAGGLRGKATIEIYKVEDNSAVARVVRLSKNARVTDTDKVANILFDQNKTLVFMPFGNFDIDKTLDPRVHAADLDRVHSMVVNNGAKLFAPRDGEEEGSIYLSPQVDYVVLGEEIDYPLEPDAGASREDRLTYERQKKYWQNYQSIVDQAKAMEIPILNQNRFLQLVGYYRR